MLVSIESSSPHVICKFKNSLVFITSTFRAFHFVQCYAYVVLLSFTHKTDFSSFGIMSLCFPPLTATIDKIWVWHWRIISFCIPTLWQHVILLSYNDIVFVWNIPRTLNRLLAPPPSSLLPPRPSSLLVPPPPPSPPPHLSCRLLVSSAGSPTRLLVRS